MEIWYSEEHTENMKLSFRIKEELAHVISKYQDIHIFETCDYGKLLVIDGTVQTTERDEFIYHEMLVHPPMLTHINPRKILIIGGGDGGAAREVLKHEPQEVHIVEIDEEVVNLSKKYLKSISSGYNDKRVHLHIEDGIKFVKKGEKYDVIIIDSTDPVKHAKGLFEEDFYYSIKNSLNSDGVLVQQCGTPFYHPEELNGVFSKLSKVFKYVKLYLAYIPTYPSGMWSFTMASNQEIKRRRKLNFKTKYYNDEIYYSSMVLPNFVNEYCKDKNE